MMNDVVTLIGEVSLTKNTLLTLPRIQGGALTAKAKRDAKTHLERCCTRISTLRGLNNPDIQMCVNRLFALAGKVAACGSNNDGGYKQMESLFAEALVELGFILGYLYAYSSLYNEKRQGVDLNRKFA